MAALNYCERLICCNLEPLEVRRIRQDITMVFKIIHGLVSLPVEDFFHFSAAATRGHSLKLCKPPCSCDVRKHYFSLRVVDIWNSLDESVVSCKSLDSFKRKLLSVDFIPFCRGRTLYSVR